MTDQLDHFFADFRASLTPEIAPAGPAAVRATVRRRRRVAATALVVTAAVLVAAPVAGYAALNGGGPEPVPGGTGTPASQESTSTPTPSPSAATTPPPAAPDGRITKADLLKARVDLPGWAPAAPCDESGARLTSVGDEDGDNLLTTVKYGDVDRDGAQETIAVVSCVFGQTGQTQVVVFDRDTAGRIVTLGRVVMTDRISGYPRPEQVGWIEGIEPLADGTVKVAVGDVQPCCGWEQEWTQKQSRTYAWQDGRFRQTGGPTRFGPNPLFTDLVVSVPDVRLLINNDGNPYGTVVVTVRNEGKLSASVALNLSFAGFEVYRIGPGWAACGDPEPATNGADSSHGCTVAEPLAAGAERTLRFGIQGAAAGPVATEGTVTVENRPNGGYLPDQKNDDNVAEFRIR